MLGSALVLGAEVALEADLPTLAATAGVTVVVVVDGGVALTTRPGVHSLHAVVQSITP